MLMPGYRGTETLDEPQRQREDRARWENQFGWKVKGSPSTLLPKGFTNRKRYFTLPSGPFDHTFVVTKTFNGHTAGTNVPGQKSTSALLTMPYGFNHSDAEKLNKWCVEHGAEWYIVGWSWWNSATVAVMVVPKS